MSLLNFETSVKSFSEDGGFHYLEVSREQMQLLGGKFLQRMTCTVNGMKFPCAIQSLGNGAGWISFSKARIKELDVQLGSTVYVDLALDRSRYGMPVPKELKKIWLLDREAKRRFENLTPGKQRNILHFVGNHKKTERRADRAKLVMRNLKRLKEGRETAPKIFGTKSKFNRQS